jgi:hypothetical protein
VSCFLLSLVHNCLSYIASVGYIIINIIFYSKHVTSCEACNMLQPVAHSIAMMLQASIKVGASVYYVCVAELHFDGPKQQQHYT